MSDFLLTLVLQIKSSKIINGMAKLSIKYEKITPFGGIFHVREQLSHNVGPAIDKVLGLRCTSFGYQYGEIAGSLASVYFCGGDCVEDVTSHLMPHQVALWGKGGWSTKSDNTSVSTIMIDMSKHFAATKIAIGDYLRI